LLATSHGDYRYNDVLLNDGSAKYIKQLSNFYDKYLAALKKYKPQDLNMTDRTSYNLLEYLLKMEKELISCHPEYMPIAQIRNQFFNLPVALTMGIWSGKSQQKCELSRVERLIDWQGFAPFRDVQENVLSLSPGRFFSVILFPRL
jgi:hypothetical protein